MKKLLFISLLLISSLAYGQNDVTRTSPVGNNPATTSTYNKQSVRDANLTAVLNLRIPVYSSFSIRNAKDSIGYVMYNSSIGRMGIYKGAGVWDTISTTTTSSLINYYTKTQSDARYPLQNGTNATGTWGIGITGNAGTVTNGVYTTTFNALGDARYPLLSGSYANPSWIASFDWSKITATPTTLAGYGITDGVPSSRTLTINGTALDLSANRGWSVGTVTSVGATAGTGISVSGSPITSSGSLTITNTAPDQTVSLTAGTGISTSGTYPNFTITNTSPSSGGTVTSLGITPGTGISVANSPITTSGNITVTNTLPDQTVSLTGGTGISTSGTYPNFTITNTSPSSSISATSPIFYNSGTGVISSRAASATLSGYVDTTTQSFKGPKTFTSAVTTVQSLVANGLVSAQTDFFLSANDRHLYGRNAANTADISLIKLDASNRVSIASGGATSIFGGSVSATNLSGTNTGDETTSRINALYGYTPANGANYLPLVGGVLSGDVAMDYANPNFLWRNSGINKLRIGIATTAGAYIAGSAINDAIVRTAGGKILFSTDDGASANLNISGDDLNGKNAMFTNTLPGSNNANFSNLSATGFGTYIRGGNGSNFALYVTDYAATNPLLSVLGNGGVQMWGLNGTDTRMVVADNLGNLSTQAIPSGGGGGTVASVSINSANGFAGTSSGGANPALTISTSINSPLLAGNGTAISAATTTGSGSTAVLSTSPTLVTPVLGVAAGTSLALGTTPATTGAVMLPNDVAVRWRNAANSANLGIYLASTNRFAAEAGLDVTGTITGSNLSGTNTGDQTSVSGNAGTATALQTARTISGTSFDGTANITLNNTGITNGAGYITSSALSPYAPLASPALTGTPTAPTASAGTNSTQIATTAYVDNAAGAGALTAISTVSSNLTLTSGSWGTSRTLLVRVDASAGAVTVNLPAASTWSGYTLIVKKIDSSGNTVTVDGSGGETIDGSITVFTTNQWLATQYVSNGTTIDIVGRTL